MTTIMIAITIAMLSSVLLIPIPNPVLTNKVHRTPTGIVFAAMFFPVLLVARRYIQIQWLPDRRLHDQNGLRVDYRRRRVVANVDLAVNTGLVDSN
jgi:hypothetical protein